MSQQHIHTHTHQHKNLHSTHLHTRIHTYLYSYLHPYGQTDTHQTQRVDHHGRPGGGRGRVYANCERSHAPSDMRPNAAVLK